MLRVSTRARYALRMMLDIARHSHDHGPVSLASISKRTEISKGYLEQVALALRSSRLLRSFVGRRGGYLLTAPPDQITIGHIFEALLGPTCLVDCVEDPSFCPRADYCECRVIYRMMNDRVQDVLRENTLADLLNPEWVVAHGGSLVPESVRRSDPEGYPCRMSREEERDPDRW
jgi:Rrf2 family protein